MPELQLQLSTSTARASWVIRVLTHSRFSHVDIIEPGKGLWGVSGKDKRIGDAGGVLLRPFNAWPYLYPPKIAKIQTEQVVIDKVFDFCRANRGKPFDSQSLYHFLRDRAGLPSVGRDWRDPDKWFCSEFALRALEVAGLFPWQLITPKDTVSPNDLLIHVNPFMDMINIIDFL